MTSSPLLSKIRGGRANSYLLDSARDACGVGFVADLAGHKSHGLIEKAIESVINLTHRGAVSADGKTGDGAGILTQIPPKLFKKAVERLGFRLPHEADLGVGVFFFPRTDQEAQRFCRRIVEGSLIRYGIQVFGWREVPMDPTALGEKALRTMPRIEQILVGRPLGLTDDEYERTLYLARKEIEAQIAGEGVEEFYIPSFSHRTIVYKGLFVAPQLSKFYLDLQDPDFEASLAVFHQRYSTNTFPNWFLAQPFRTLGHNGEINTLQGNRNWIYAREQELFSPIFGSEVEKLRPIVMPGGSDSMSLDNVLEALTMAGRDICHAMMMLIPEAWENMPDMDPDLRAFYEYHACLMEPWDGPAAVAFTDGVVVGATLDRNGLRPARYKVTEDGLVIMASEVGVIEVDDSQVVQKGRLGPGQMIAVDTKRGLLFLNEELKREVSQRRPYRAWLSRQILRLSAPPPAAYLPPDRGWLLRQQLALGYTAEDLNLVLKPMFVEKKEPVGAMGDDTPLAVLSKYPRLLYSYFKQRFAQVTNPPIDPLREQLVMALNMYLGARGSFLEETEEHAKLIALQSPILFEDELDHLRSLSDPAFASITLSTLFDAEGGASAMEGALFDLCDQASRAVDQGKTLIILSDRGV
ncbi:MAG: glutamate synthase central domain-containing protein, partial [Candidatus Methylomirabilales bacterium]